MGRGPYDPNIPGNLGLAREAQGRARPVNLAPSQPPGLGQEVGIRLPGANFPPAGARAADPIGDASIAPGAAATLITVTVPDNLRLAVVGIGFDTDDSAAAGYLTWAILLGADPSPSYEQMQSAIGSLGQLATIFVLVGSSQTLRVRATIAATAPITYRYECHLRGWFYVEKEGA
jgi:hypothetical protein